MEETKQQHYYRSLNTDITINLSCLVVKGYLPIGGFFAVYCSWLLDRTCDGSDGME